MMRAIQSIPQFDYQLDVRKRPRQGRMPFYDFLSLRPGEDFTVYRSEYSQFKTLRELQIRISSIACTRAKKHNRKFSVRVDQGANCVRVFRVDVPNGWTAAIGDLLGYSEHDVNLEEVQTCLCAL
jgi:hypothetical protein